MASTITPSAATVQTGVNPSSSFNADDRAIELIEEIRNLAAKMGIDPEDLDIEFDYRFNIEAEVRNLFFDYHFQISPLFILKYEDIPVEWRGITSENDPRLKTPGFLVGVDNHLRTMFAGTKRLGRVEIDPADLLTFLFALEDQRKFDQAKEFTLAHELSHIKHYELKKIPSIVETIRTIWCKVISVLIPFLYPVADQASLILRHILTDKSDPEQNDRIRAYLKKDSKVCEKYADLDAAEALGTAEGGLHLFSVLLKANQVLLKLKILKNATDYNDKGDFLFDKDHPLHSVRFAYLQNWQNMPRQLPVR